MNISGTDFAGVDFGAVPAAGFTVDSEGQITAVWGSRDHRRNRHHDRWNQLRDGGRPLRIHHLRRPGLKHKKRQAAKRKLRKAGYKVGRVKREDGVTAKVGEVVKQGRKPGKKLAPGTKVNITLG